MFFCFFFVHSTHSTHTHTHTHPNIAKKNKNNVTGVIHCWDCQVPKEALPIENCCPIVCFFFYIFIFKKKWNDNQKKTKMGKKNKFVIFFFVIVKKMKWQSKKKKRTKPGENNQIRYFFAIVLYSIFFFLGKNGRNLFFGQGEFVFVLCWVSGFAKTKWWKQIFKRASLPCNLFHIQLSHTQTFIFFLQTLEASKIA